MKKLKALSILVAVMFCLNILTPAFAAYNSAQNYQNSNDQQSTETSYRKVNENVKLESSQGEKKGTYLTNKSPNAVNYDGECLVFKCKDSKTNQDFDIQVPLPAAITGALFNKQIKLSDISVKVKEDKFKEIGWESQGNWSKIIYSIDSNNVEIRLKAHYNDDVGVIEYYDPKTDEFNWCNSNKLTKEQINKCIKNFNNLIKDPNVSVEQAAKNLRTTIKNYKEYNERENSVKTIKPIKNGYKITTGNGKVKKIKTKGLTKQQKKKYKKQLKKAKTMKEINKIEKSIKKDIKNNKIDKKIKDKYGKKGLKQIKVIARITGLKKEKVLNKLSKNKISKKQLENVYNQVKIMNYNDTKTDDFSYEYNVGNPKTYLNRAISNVEKGKTVRKLSEAEKKKKFSNDSSKLYKFL